MKKNEWMKVKSVKDDVRLYQSQVLILQILYKFRFGTNDLIAKYRSVKRSAINESVLTLLRQGYIARRYDKRSKIEGEGARYYLSSKGIKYLKDRFTLSDKVVQAQYKNRIVSDDFIAHSLTVFKAYLLLKNHYGDRYDVFTKSEMAKFDAYPEQLPDLFLAAKDKPDPDYMLNVFLKEPFFVIKKRIKYYIDHRNEEWDDATPYPSILLVCPDARNEAKVIQYTESQLEDFDFLITTVKALLEGGPEVWTNPVDSDKPLTL